MGEMRSTYNMLVAKPEGKRPRWRPRHRWKNNIIMDLRENGKLWTLLLWFRIGTSGGVLSTRK
jgi:hypothetical protein